MAAEASATALVTSPLVLLAAAVVAVPIFKRLGLGSVVGYLAAGVAIGPQVLALFGDPGAILHVAELGVVMFLFLIGLELEPQRLWSMRRNIFGLGSVQILAAGLGVGAALYYGLGTPWREAVVVGAGLALSSTAIVMQMLEERGETRTPAGEKAFAILLMQDLAIVPLLALVTLVAPQTGATGDGFLLATGKMVGAVVVVVVAGRYLLNPMFRFLAAAEAREIMTAAALMIVLGAAAAMALAGLSMAMGAFLAGVMLAESNFRHQLAADVEPFRGILMGLFFLSVGMTVDLSVITADWRLVLGGLIALLMAKFVTVHLAVRLFGGSRGEAMQVSALLIQGGEFGFVLYQSAAVSGAIAERSASIAVAVTTLSMALTPLVVAAIDRLRPKPGEDSIEEDFTDVKGSVLLVGFGRFGQIVSQLLLANGTEVTIIDNDTDMIRSAARFGFRIYYGDGTRLDVLRAAGAERAELIVVATDGRETTDRVVDLIQAEFPNARLFVRSFDRGHTLSLKARNVEFEIRETYESALAFGRATLIGLGLDPDAASDLAEQVRQRDRTRLALQEAGGIMAGRGAMLTEPSKPAEPEPEPLIEPKRPSRALNRETESVARTEKAASGSR
ncbi:monovalent cation:proton antiporter-2 (CPA2) family protein [Prosthecodimorpha staleyi]|uniref:Monovalent cation:proton antiporter-2 (CPA2) family protein n=1 Tax=Prosthecodimorpha staleyi TaxID=2840188 RepID=A0A947D755_9HYPH|nr:monovalent cation:proton antiporter-2 (CPA2) family protein [Prosthecodimorpha staleyi]MBT9289437.1 monovalent cation:proton antiporter-2 (CPA2) family protein [Prosthecodimorpha staleyi]